MDQSDRLEGILARVERGTATAEEMTQYAVYPITAAEAAACRPPGLLRQTPPGLHHPVVSQEVCDGYSGVRSRIVRGA